MMLTTQINENNVLASHEPRANKMLVLGKPVEIILATPGAFLGGIAIGSALVAAFESGRNG
jgi:hypothetical protein